ncbi:hypothetical protein [Streptomyces wuyuanensis]|uniref:hypothetical protein n=1 Tax=Streptomyces wuyuanensis TaxID=1196353 RepID=UPI003794F41C
MKIRADIAEMLRNGVTDTDIAARAHVTERTAAAARAALGIPKCRAGRKPQQSIEQALLDRSRPIDDGHRQWTGATYGKHQHLKHNGRRYTAARAAFIARYDREPVGAVIPGCGLPGCVAPDHMEDRPMRDRNRAVFAAIFGGSA